MASSLEIKEIEGVVKSSLQNIKSNCRTISSKHGWHQFLGTEKIGNVATSQALILLDLFEEDFDKKHQAIDQLIKSQIDNPNQSHIDGGWSFVTNFTDYPTTEATCWSLIALHKNYRDVNAVSKGIQWIIKNKISNNGDQGWGTIKSDTSRVHSTCLALTVLKLYGKQNIIEYEEGLNWLMRNQNIDNGWGPLQGQYSTLFHTALALNVLLDNRLHNQLDIQKGIDWIDHNFVTYDFKIVNEKMGYQEIIEFDVQENGKKKHQRLIYYHNPIQHVLKLLLKVNRFNSKKFFDSIHKLTHENNGGYWMHPHFASNHQKPIWVIYDTLTLFKEFLEHSKRNGDVKKIIFYRGNIHFVKTTKPFSVKYFLQNFILGAWGKIFVLILVAVLFFYYTRIFGDWQNHHLATAIVIPLGIELLGYYLTEVKKAKK